MRCCVGSTESTTSAVCYTLYVGGCSDDLIVASRGILGVSDECTGCWPCINRCCSLCVVVRLSNLASQNCSSGHRGSSHCLAIGPWLLLGVMLRGPVYTPLKRRIRLSSFVYIARQRSNIASIHPSKCCEYASAVCCSLWLPGGNVAAYIRTLLPKQHCLYR
jgi:hypothetical protein